ncbi:MULTISPECIES: class F sortase [unclassified Streptomyces]|uniref:class F sortase n=1 Tax=unclassified Streptomyces TaxID=2593676 RepID=UPI00225AC47B|nr:MULTISPECIES: class F sortase [unclassified Streptomyces]MCX4990683.1 class F sortase [Streptomyces sp. NBC_00568]MCX5004086.1 class F sortase [Streptomyces sp. NBC_00638]
MAERERSPGAGRLLTGVAWLVLLLGLWLWGRQVTDLRLGISAPTTGDIAAVGRPPEVRLPPALKPLGNARPQRVDIPSMGVQAPVVARGLDRRGGIDPPPYEQPGVVGWYAAGAKPGAAGTALMVGHVDTETRPAVFYKLSAVKPGDTVRVVRDDGTVAEFTVDDVQVLARDHFDARQAYGERQSGRAELRLITCGGTFDRTSGSYTANVIVSAYLTGNGP